MEETILTVKAVFDVAHEIASPAERQAYLDRVCGSAPELRSQVEALLRAYDEAGSILEPPGAAGPATGPYQPDAAVAEQPSHVEAVTITDPPQDTGPLSSTGQDRRIGPYRVLQPLGEGGMGAVYLAEQAEPVRRQVALKIIKPGMDSAQVVARFEAERQALAMMDHPNIARVYDAGTIPGEPGSAGSGRPFFVMELVQGVPLTRFCDQNKLSLRDRLQLFIPVCQAIQHAHQKGVIHRDIKPSNVLVTLVDGKPVPKVIDFGIAKAIQQPLTAEPAFTQLGAVLGTLEYMSPEQADGNPLGVDTRSDVYSLGVLLYELLTGVTPLDQTRLRKSGLMDALLMIIEEEPPRPSTRLSGLGERQTTIAARRQTEPARLTRTLRGELDWIVMKTLEKDRTRRYGTASELAADVQRYLDDEPVLACPPTLRYRLGKFTRKHWIGLTLASGLMTLLVVGIIGLIGTLIVVSNARQKTEGALSAEKQARTQTRGLLSDSTDAIGTLVAAQPVLGPGVQFMLRQLLSRYEQVAGEWGNNQESHELAAEGQAKVGRLHELLGEPSEAEAGYRKAARLYADLAAQVPDVPRFRDELARQYSNLGLLLLHLDKPQPAEEALQRAIEVWAQLRGEVPAERDYAYNHAVALDRLGMVFHRLHADERAEQAHRQAITSLEAIVTPPPGLPPYVNALADAYNNLGVVLTGRPGQRDAAGRAYASAVRVRRELAVKDPAKPLYQLSLGRSQFNLALWQSQQGQLEAAAQTYGQAIATQTKLVTAFPSVPEYRLDLASSLNNLGTVLSDEAKSKQATSTEQQAQLFAQAQAVDRQAIFHAERLAAQHPDQIAYRLRLAASYGNLGNAVREQHHPADSLTWYGKAIALLRPIVALQPQAGLFLRNRYWDRANALGQLGRHAEAIQDWQQAIQLDPGPARPSLELFLASAKLEEKLSQRMASVAVPEWYGAARTFAQASAAAASQDEVGLQKHYAARALELLQQAGKAGYFHEREHLARLKTDRALDAVRTLPGFRALLTTPANP